MPHRVRLRPSTHSSRISLGYDAERYSGERNCGSSARFVDMKRRGRSRSRNCRARNTSCTTTCRSKPTTADASMSSLSATWTRPDQEQVIQCNIRDITARKLGDRAHRTSDERYLVAVRLRPGRDSDRRQQGRYIDANKTICRMLGIHPQGADGDARADSSHRPRPVR